MERRWFRLRFRHGWRGSALGTVAVAVSMNKEGELLRRMKIESEIHGESTRVLKFLTVVLFELFEIGRGIFVSGLKPQCIFKRGFSNFILSCESKQIQTQKCNHEELPA